MRRCREWYATGKRKALARKIPIHITAPYLFAGAGAYAQSATSPLIDPRTGYYVGQVLLDFSITPIFDVLTKSSTPLSVGGFPLLITVGTDAFGGDTVIGPGFSGSFSAIPVSQVVIPFDQNCTRDGGSKCIDRKRRFMEIVESMKTGKTSTERFERTANDGDGGTETVFIAYSPIAVKFLDPVMSSDFSRGALSDDYLIYSIGLAETEQGVLAPFEGIRQDMERQKHVAIGILVAVIVIAFAADLYISYLVARSISEPMQFIIGLIRSLGQLDVGQDPPMVDNTTGSREIVNVTNTMESLYRVVRMATMSYYAGDLEAAYHVLLDALRLFKRLDNEKAVGVASNNLGNTLLAMYREMQNQNLTSRYGVTRDEAIIKGTAYFTEAIQLGEKGYDEFYNKEGWSPNCLDFMQHLSNRYFNRAIFLLTVKDDRQQPGEIERLGFRDLDIARDMDAEIVTQGEESGWGRVNRSEKLFNVRLVRIRGQLLLLEMGYSEDDLETAESLNELFQLLADELRKPNSDLFKEVDYIGRLQEAETEMMKYMMIKGDISKASKIAVRMLFEDEYVFVEAATHAINVLQAYIDTAQCDFDEMTHERVRKCLKDILYDLLDNLKSKRQSVVSSRDHSIASKSLRNASGLMPRNASAISWSTTERSGRFVTMEQF